MPSIREKRKITQINVDIITLICVETFKKAALAAFLLPRKMSYIILEIYKYSFSLSPILTNIIL